MDYSSLILMEKDNETGFVTKELGSFNVSEGAEYIKGFYETCKLLLCIEPIRYIKSEPCSVLTTL